MIESAIAMFNVSFAMLNVNNNNANDFTFNNLDSLARQVSDISASVIDNTYYFIVGRTSWTRTKRYDRGCGFKSRHDRRHTRPSKTTNVNISSFLLHYSWFVQFSIQNHMLPCIHYIRRRMWIFHSSALSSYICMSKINVCGQILRINL
jgi:hypothetical protein